MGRDARYEPRLTREEMERRRLLAAVDLDAGMQQRKVARKFGVSEATVSRWAKTLRTRGKSGLKRTMASRPPKLSDEELAELLQILLHGAQESGYDTNIWTTQRVVEVIEKNFGVKYNPDHVGRMLREKLGMSYQKPKRRANERSEEARATWLRTTWPRLKKDS